VTSYDFTKKYQLVVGLGDGSLLVVSHNSRSIERLQIYKRNNTRKQEIGLRCTHIIEFTIEDVHTDHGILCLRPLGIVDDDDDDDGDTDSKPSVCYSFVAGFQRGSIKRWNLIINDETLRESDEGLNMKRKRKPTTKTKKRRKRKSDNHYFVGEYIGHTSSVFQVVTMTMSSPLDGNKKVLVSCGRDNRIKVWDLDSYVCLKTVAGHRDTVADICVIDDFRGASSSTLLASSSLDNTIALWDLSSESDECLARIRLNFNRDRFGFPKLISLGNGVLWCHNEWQTFSWDYERSMSSTIRRGFVEFINGIQRAMRINEEMVVCYRQSRDSDVVVSAIRTSPSSKVKITTRDDINRYALFNLTKAECPKEIVNAIDLKNGFLGLIEVDPLNMQVWRLTPDRFVDAFLGNDVMYTI